MTDTKRWIFPWSVYSSWLS